MSHATHPCPTAPPAPALDPAARALRVEVDPATGRLTLDPADAVRVALALAHLSSFVHWSPHSRASDDAIAHEAAWMAESLGDHARSTTGP